MIEMRNINEILKGLVGSLSRKYTEAGFLFIGNETLVGYIANEDKSKKEIRAYVSFENPVGNGYTGYLKFSGEDKEIELGKIDPSEMSRLESILSNVFRYELEEFISK